MDKLKDRETVAGLRAESIGEAPGGADARIDSGLPESGKMSPSTIYLPSCGVLCDIFWWARWSAHGPKSDL
jgi:hypothetical protein